jgi:N-acetylglucosaminyldiphosphoundecaprenol N-acetyl-beta-D-mannosaminyltransferase
MKHDVLSVRIDDIDDNDLVIMLQNWVDSDEQKIIVTPNPEMLLLARQKKKFAELLQNSHLAIPDGVGLRFAIAALSDYKMMNRHTGVDLVQVLSAICSQSNKRVLLFGGENNSAKLTSEVLNKAFPSLTVKYFDPGMLKGGVHSVDLPESVAQTIASHKPDVLFVALGHGKQERFMHEHLHRFPSIKIAAGIGGSFESISSMKPRAPGWMRRKGLEWLWRVAIEPRRTKRILRAIFVFPGVVIWSTIKERRFLKAVKQVMPEIYDQIKKV